MAEVYGVKPKKFTREWWPYFWMYYKWHTIGIVAAAACIISFVVQCATKPKYDLALTFAGGAAWKSGAADALRDALSENIEDADGNGQKNLLIETVVMDRSGTDVQMNYDLQVKVDIMTGEDIYNLYMFDAEEAELMLGRSDGESAPLLFMPVAEWAEKEYDEDRLLIRDGVAYGVSVEDSELLKSCGVTTKGLYILVRNPKDGNELSAISNKSAVKVANKILE